MITKAEAIKIVEEFLIDVSRRSKHKMKLIPDSIRDFEYGWVFFYQSERYIETGDVMERIVGNGPVIVNRYDSSIVELGTAHRSDWYLREYVEKMRRENRF